MSQPDAIRLRIRTLRRAQPFRPFALKLQDGESFVVGHPENIAFDSYTDQGVGGSDDFYMISGGLRMFNTFGAITRIALIDQLQV